MRTWVRTLVLLVAIAVFTASGSEVARALARVENPDTIYSDGVQGNIASYLLPDVWTWKQTGVTARNTAGGVNERFSSYLEYNLTYGKMWVVRWNTVDGVVHTEAYNVADNWTVDNVKIAVAAKYSNYWNAYWRTNQLIVYNKYWPYEQGAVTRTWTDTVPGEYMDAWVSSVYVLAWNENGNVWSEQAAMWFPGVYWYPDSGKTITFAYRFYDWTQNR